MDFIAGSMMRYTMGTFVNDWTNMSPAIVFMSNTGAPRLGSLNVVLMTPAFGFRMNVHAKALKRRGTLNPRTGRSSRTRFPRRLSWRRTRRSM